jgi:uncharacterized protein YjbJ (UPF0337 family)
VDWNSCCLRSTEGTLKIGFPPIMSTTHGDCHESRSTEGRQQERSRQIQEGIGRRTGNGSQQIKGASKQVIDKVQKAFGNVREGLKGKRSI